MLLAEFLSGHVDRDQEFKYLRELVKDEISLTLMKIHVKDMIERGIIQLVIDQPKGNLFVPSDLAGYGGMVIDYTLHTRTLAPVTYKDLPYIIVLGRRSNPTGYYPIEVVSVRIPTFLTGQVMNIHYARWRPPHTRALPREKTSVEDMETEYEMITLNEQ